MTTFSDFTYGNPSRHHIQYCGKSFTVNGHKFTYLRGDFDFFDGIYQEAVVFTDGKFEYWKSGKEFFQKISYLELLKK